MMLSVLRQLYERYRKFALPRLELEEGGGWMNVRKELSESSRSDRSLVQGEFAQIGQR